MPLKINSLSIRSRLILMLILVSAISGIVLIYIGYISGKESISESIFNQLTSVKASKKYQIESYFDEIANLTEVLGTNEMIVSALRDFKKGYKEISKQEIPPECNQQLSNHYNDFIDRMSQNIDVKSDIDIYYPKSLEACHLQYNYIVTNPHPLGEKQKYLNSEDYSAYGQAHQKYHTYLSELTSKFGFYDIFLIDLERGDIVYTAYKETDFATNLYTGPYRESNLADLSRILRSNSDLSKAKFIDFEAYRPSYGAPAAFVGMPVTEGAEVIGALVLQLPVDEINRIMTGSNNWEADGLGQSGETYLVGEDYLMRSISRFYLQDTVGYTEALMTLGIEKEAIERMYRIGTTILNQRVKTEGVAAALAGKNETRIIEDYRHIPVLSSYAPLHLRDLNWAILSELDEAEANIPIYKFQKKVFIALCIIILLVTFFAMYLAGKFVRPIELLSEGVHRISNGDYSQEIDIHTNDEIGELAHSFNEMTHNIDEQQQLLEQHSLENEKLLLNFIPETIAKRLQQGEKNIVETYPNVSLVAIDITGFSELTSSLGPSESINLLNSIVEAFDIAAHKHHVEKIRTVGDSYFAACGMFYPRLDHAKRILEFGLELRQLIIQFNINYNIKLSLNIGIHSGEVIAGIVGNEKFSYDLWGKTINEVFMLRDAADDHEILVSTEIHNKTEGYFVFKKTELPKSSRVNVDAWKFVEERKKA